MKKLENFTDFISEIILDVLREGLSRPHVRSQVLVKHYSDRNIGNGLCILSMKFEPAFSLSGAELVPFGRVEHFCRDRRRVTAIS